MSVVLRTSCEIPDASVYDFWLAIQGDGPGLDPARRLTGVPDLLERTYERALREWRAVAPRLAVDPGAERAHTPACTPNISDFGEMLAWTDIVDQIARAAEHTLVICDDPWLFRHLAGRTGVLAGTPPPLAPRALKLAVRGLLARVRVAAKSIAATLALRHQRARFPTGAAVLVVYGHPASTVAGNDGYFGDLMNAVPCLVRLLHVDCDVHRAKALCADGRTFSLHGWGRVGEAVELPFRIWRGGGNLLLRRSRAREAATGQPAMIGWQMICQREWLVAARPRVVAWPWENHAWERDFVRTARALGVATVGYQHATIGHQEANYAPDCNGDGLASIPDVIVASGPAGRDALHRLGYCDGRVVIGGALRFAAPRHPRYDAAGPIFVALPFDCRVAREMVEAVCPLARAGRRVLVRAHPMSPFDFKEEANLARAETALGEIEAVAAVVYAGTSVGLEARIAGLPTFRFKAAGCVPNDIIPTGLDIVAVTAEGLAIALASAEPPAPVEFDVVFARPDYDLWQRLLG